MLFVTFKDNYWIDAGRWLVTVLVTISSIIEPRSRVDKEMFRLCNAVVLRIGAIESVAERRRLVNVSHAVDIYIHDLRKVCKPLNLAALSSTAASSVRHIQRIAHLPVVLGIVTESNENNCGSC